MSRRRSLFIGIFLVLCVISPKDDDYLTSIGKFIDMLLSSFLISTAIFPYKK